MRQADEETAGGGRALPVDAAASERIDSLAGLPDPLPIQPLTQPPDAVVTVPGSKSMTNRALILAALADGDGVIDGALWADDTRYMAAALNQLGIPVQFDQAARRVHVNGRAGVLPAQAAELYTGNAGTATRFLTALCSLGTGAYIIDGTPRMRERPIEPLCDALRQWGADVRSTAGTGCPPLAITGPLPGGTARLDSRLSSQYLSALLMVGPYAAAKATIELVGTPPARPYVDMTIAMMARQGVPVTAAADGSRWQVPRGVYRPDTVDIEPDASSAAYFWSAAAISGGRVTVRGTSRRSCQGDTEFVDILAKMGCGVVEGEEGITVTGPADGVLHGVDVDLNFMSDMTATLAALAPFCHTPVRIRNVAHVRVQETDRLAAIATELSRLGITVAETADGLHIEPGQPRPAVIETYADHRMAMAFALIGLRVPGIAIADPACVAKSFPDFFTVLAELGPRD